MGIREKLSYLQKIRHDHGVFEALRAGWLGFRYGGSTRMILYALYEPRPMADSITAAQDHVFRFATPEDLARLSTTPSYEIAPIDIERVNQGTARCLLQLDGDNLVGYAWIWTNRLAYIDSGIHINLPDDTIYNYKGYTNPAYRGSGFQALRHLQLLKLTRDEGVRRLFAFVDQYNIRSLNGVRKSGYLPVGEIIFRARDGKKVQLRMNVDHHFWSFSART
ncbi:MAG: hypothetical protein RLZZ200_357 [Pseudomonadota bacterium]|jgi:RimJ/RimL family protein N-acetyltransferase